MNHIAIITTILLSTFSHLLAQWKQTTVSTGENIIALAANSNTIFAATHGDSIYVSTDSGVRWFAAAGTVNDTIISLATSGQDVFVGTQGGGVFRSTNNGESWKATSAGMGNDTVLALLFSGSNLYAGTRSGVYRSTDSGATWLAAGLAVNVVMSIAASDTEIFAGTGNNEYRSTDYGMNWISMGLKNYPAYCFALKGVNVFIGSGEGDMFSTTNNGLEWTIFPIHMTYQPIQSLIMVGDNILAGTAGEGMFVTSDTNTSDYGNNWFDRNNGLSFGDIHTLILFGNNIFAGTYNGGIWERTLTDLMLGVHEQAMAPNKNSLLHAYPNPFTTSTHIILSSSEMDAQRISIMDMLGKEVTSFSKVSSGSIDWTPDASIPAGTYFLFVKTPTGIMSKPIVLLR